MFFLPVHYLVSMRVIGEINHPECKVTLFHWNNRYLIKIEQGLLEQTYKVPEYDVPTEDEVKRLVNDAFIAAALRQFEAMRQSLHEALQTI
jgi:hypothetical protein